MAAKKRYWTVSTVAGKDLQVELQRLSDAGLTIFTVAPGVTVRFADCSFFVVAWEEK